MDFSTEVTLTQPAQEDKKRTVRALWLQFFTWPGMAEERRAWRSHCWGRVRHTFCPRDLRLGHRARQQCRGCRHFCCNGSPSSRHQKRGWTVPGPWLRPWLWNPRFPGTHMALTAGVPGPRAGRALWKSMQISGIQGGLHRENRRNPGQGAFSSADP